MIEETGAQPFGDLPLILKWGGSVPDMKIEVTSKSIDVLDVKCTLLRVDRWIPSERSYTDSPDSNTSPITVNRHRLYFDIAQSFGFLSTGRERLNIGDTGCRLGVSGYS